LIYDVVTAAAAVPQPAADMTVPPGGRPHPLHLQQEFSTGGEDAREARPAHCAIADTAGARTPWQL